MQDTIKNDLYIVKQLYQTIKIWQIFCLNSYTQWYT